MTKIQAEMDFAKVAFEKQLEIETNGPDYRELTGINVLAEFESKQDAETHFSAFFDEDSKTSAILQFIASKMLDIEHFCNELDPWERNDISRESWISTIDDICSSYEVNIVLGQKPKVSGDEIVSPTKRQRKSLESSTISPKSSSGNASLSHVLSSLKVSAESSESFIYSITSLINLIYPFSRIL